RNGGRGRRIDDPMRTTFQQLTDKTRMQRMAGAIGNEAAQDGLADEGEIAKQIERLVPDEFVRKTKGRVVQHSRFGKDDSILQRSASHETARLKLFDFMIKTERTRRRNEVGIIRSGQLDLETLLSDQRMRKVDVILNRERIRWVDAERLAAVFENEFFRDPDVLPGPL